MIKVHRGEAKYTSMTDLQWTSTETKSSQVLNNSPFHNFTADAYNHNQTIHDQNSQNHFFLCYITGNQTPKCTPPHPVNVYSYEGTFFFFFFFFMAPAPGLLRKAPVEIQTNSHGSLNPAPGWLAAVPANQKPSREYLPINWDFMSTTLVNFCTTLAHVSQTNLKWSRQLTLWEMYTLQDRCYEVAGVTSGHMTQRKISHLI